MQKKTKIKLGVSIALGAIAISVAATVGGVVATQQKVTHQSVSNNNQGPLYIVPNASKMTSFQDGFSTTTNNLLKSRQDFNVMTGFNATPIQFNQLKTDVLNSQQYKSTLQINNVNVVKHANTLNSPQVGLNANPTTPVPQGIIKLLKDWANDFNTFGTDMNSAISKLKGITSALQNVIYYAGWLLPSSTKQTVETVTKVAEWAESISEKVLSPLANLSVKISNMLNNWSNSKILNEIQDFFNQINAKVDAFFNSISQWFQSVLKNHPILMQAWNFIQAHIISPVKTFFSVTLKNWFTKIYNSIKDFIIVEEIRSKVSSLQAPSSLKNFTALQAVDAQNKVTTENAILKLIQTTLSNNLSLNTYTNQLTIYKTSVENNVLYVYLGLNNVHTINSLSVTGFKTVSTPVVNKPAENKPSSPKPDVIKNTNVIQFNIELLNKVVDQLAQANKALAQISAPTGYESGYGFKELLTYKNAFSSQNQTISTLVNNMKSALETFSQATNPTVEQQNALANQIETFNTQIAQQQKAVATLIETQNNYVKDSLTKTKIWINYLWSSARRTALENDVSYFNTYYENLNNFVNLSVLLNNHI